MKRFHNRSERQTGQRMMIVGTDGGNEFNGEFLAYLEQQGIIKRKGAPYDHHYPGKAENAHKVISGMARSMLLASKLPELYYGKAQLTACYLLNRWSDKGKESRFEKFFGKLPKIDHLQPFGAIGYAFIPSEKRSKIEPTREKCRLIGYADDFESEEMAGYKLLLESDSAIVYSNDVVWKDEVICELPNSDLDPFSPDWHDVFLYPAVDDESDNDLSGLTGSTQVETPEAAESDNSDSETSDEGELVESEMGVEIDSEASGSVYESETSEDQRQDAILDDLNSRYFEEDQNMQESQMNSIVKDLKTRAWFDEEGDQQDLALVNFTKKVFATHKIDKTIPDTLKQAIQSPEAAKWKEAQDIEMLTFILAFDLI